MLLICTVGLFPHGGQKFPTVGGQPGEGDNQERVAGKGGTLETVRTPDSVHFWESCLEGAVLRSLSSGSCPEERVKAVLRVKAALRELS